MLVDLICLTDNLDNAGPIAQDYEYDFTLFSDAMDPSSDGHVIADLRMKILN
jgi:hypothetical protein